MIFRPYYYFDLGCVVPFRLRHSARARSSMPVPMTSTPTLPLRQTRTSA